MTEDMPQDPRVQMMAKRLLMGEGDAPPSAWLLRADLLQRTWAWQAAKRILEAERRPPAH